MSGLTMTISVTDIKEVKALVESAIDLDRLLKGCEKKTEIDHSVELRRFRKALDDLAELAENTLNEIGQGQLSPPEIVELHQNGTLCEQCGAVIGEPRLCKGCEDGNA